MVVIIKKDIVSQATKNILPKGSECKVQEVNKKEYMVYYNGNSWFVDKKDVIEKGDDYHGGKW
jgi:membrane protein implicated in regulation of membrane protease activity